MFVNVGFSLKHKDNFNRFSVVISFYFHRMSCTFNLLDQYFHFTVSFCLSKWLLWILINTQQFIKVHIYITISYFCPLFILGYCGQLPNRPSIVLIASHADKAGCPKNARGEYVSPVASSILAKIQQKFRNDLDIVERVFVLDTPVAMTPDIKALKHQLYQLRANILRVSI